jgi:serine/threonine protein kinase
MPPPSVESLCNQLARSRLLTPEQVRGLYQRWRGEARDAADLDAFRQWLVAGGHVTEYQTRQMLRGHVDHFFFGPYKILERVGKGRMAGVYKAVHTLGQLVAIKVLPPSKARDPQLLARFQREARLALKLKHPNVVRAFQAGDLDGLHYLVMEYLDGETLEEVLRRRGPLPPAEAARLLYQALLGLQHLHEQGMIHRDLKPGNLMLLGGAPASTQQATVKIMDIGLGKALFDEGAPPGGPGNFELTNQGSLLGTPDYMAPEQARNAQAADIRSDIYSLGCTLYQTLAGQVPFPETNLVRQLMRHATEPPRRLRPLNPAVPDGLQQIVDWMMAKDPAARYPTPERAAQALQVFLAAGADAPAQPEGGMRAYLDWLDRQPAEATATAPATETAVAPAPPPVELVPVKEEQSERYPKAPPETKKRKPEREATPPAPPKRRKPERVAPGKKKRRVRDDEDEDEETEAPRGLSRRDSLMIAVGGVVLGVVVLVLGGVAWALLHFFGGAAEDTPQPPDDGSQPPAPGPN